MDGGGEGGGALGGSCDLQTRCNWARKSIYVWFLGFSVLGLGFRVRVQSLGFN